jgi:dolichol-phosphate mannosyltransferase
MATLTIVVPCYNEEEVLPELFQRINAAAPAWEKDFGISWQVLCIDDGSRDKTWELLQTQSQKDSHWQALRLSRNFGHQPAVTAGLAHAKGDAVLVIDADLQDPPEIFGEFIKKWREGFQVVYAVRTKRKENWFRKLCYWGYYRLLAKLADFKMPLDSGDFALIDRKVVDAMNALPEHGRYLRGLRAWVGFKQIGVIYERPARAAGYTKYNLRRSFNLALNGIFSFSKLPLRVVTSLGFWTSIIAFLGIIFTLLQRIFAEEFAFWGLSPTPGYATIVLSVLFMGGVQLICLGVIGEYVGRVYDEVKGRPAFIVAEETSKPSLGFSTDSAR